MKFIRIFGLTIFLLGAFSSPSQAGWIYIVTKSTNPQWKAYDSVTPCGEATDFARFSKIWKADQEKPQRMASWNQKCSINEGVNSVTCVSKAGTTQNMFWFEKEKDCTKARKGK